MQVNRRRDAMLFRIGLRDVRPEIWRQVWVPARYSFWDLHVAIQDAMGWLDCHLHEFEVPAGLGDRRVVIGIPDEEGWPGARKTLPGREHALADYMSEPGFVMCYRYDFGDEWQHEVALEAIAPREKGRRYPRCVDGENACPPEDCGGPHGFEELVRMLSNPVDPNYQDLAQWIPEGWQPDVFDPEQVRFSNPTIRWRRAFGP